MQWPPERAEFAGHQSTLNIPAEPPLLKYGDEGLMRERNVEMKDE